MTRRGILAAILALGVGVASCTGGDRARDVLVVTLDTTRADHLGCYGDESARTPNLDALAGEGALFEQAVAPVPVTLPSHSTMFTGLNPYRHGVRYNLMFVLPEEQVTLAERLRDEGFATGAVVSSFVLVKRFGLAQGFDDYRDGFQFEEGKTVDDQPSRPAADSVDLALDWWRANAGSRRFLWLHLWDPHYRYHPPFPFSARFEGRPYAGEIAYADAELGRLFDELREAGDWDDALVVVAGDHGEGLYEHGERWHGDLVFESTLRVPFLVKPPRSTEPRRIEQPVGLVDLAPTVLDYAGAPPIDDPDGIPLRESIENGEAPLRSVYFESIADNLTYGWAGMNGVRRASYKYVEGGRAELYDLAADPGETVDRRREDPQRAEDLASELAAFLAREAEGSGADAGAVLDEETLQKLASLGYVGGPASGRSQLEEATHPPDQVDLLQELLRAQGLVAAKNWAAAADSLDFILRRDPRNRSALNARAHVHAAVGDLASALTTAEALARLYPDSKNAPDLVAQILSASDRPAEAAEVLARALEKHPEDGRLRFHRFLSLMEADELEAAEVEAETLEASRPEDYTTAVARSMLEAAHGRTAASLDALERAVDLGLRDFRSFDQSDLFEEARRDPRFADLRHRASAGEQGS